MKKIISKIASRLLSLVPTRNLIVFTSVPDFADNSYALYKYMIRMSIDDDYDIVWLIVDKARIPDIAELVYCSKRRTSVIYKYSFRGVWSYVRARYVFETHGLFPLIKLTQHEDKHICLWHGMPLKALGATIGMTSSPNSDYTIASSEIFCKIMAEAFAKPCEKVLISGQPRCDLLFEKSEYLVRIGFDKSKYRSVGIWLPTYRKSIYGDIREDGAYKEGYVSIISISDLTKLDDYLEQIGGYLFIKLHIMDILQRETFPDLHNIKIIKQKDFNDQLYPLLGECDYLLTDYSSVFVDYEILQRPIGFVMDDIDEYRNSRGLNFSNLNQVLPGPIIEDFESLLNYINSPSIKQSQIVWNKYRDANASMRVCSSLECLKLYCKWR